MVWSLGFERRIDPRAVVDLERASRMEPASTRRISRAWDRARYRLQARAFYSAGARNRRQQPARVRIERIAEQLGRVRLLHHARGVENRHIVGILGDHAEIVRYQDDRETEPRLRSRIRSRICAWIVTSSAVVGSSAISRRGLHASAIAIITRWRIPPDN